MKMTDNKYWSVIKSLKTINVSHQTVQKNLKNKNGIHFVNVQSIVSTWNEMQKVIYMYLINFISQVIV